MSVYAKAAVAALGIRQAFDGQVDLNEWASAELNNGKLHLVVIIYMF
jgi:hypothetical protein